MEQLNFKNLHYDMHKSQPPVQPDDFLVAIGQKKSNTVYHVYSVKPGKVGRKKGRLRPYVKRFHLKVLKSDLATALQRESNQKLWPIYWYK